MLSGTLSGSGQVVPDRPRPARALADRLGAFSASVIGDVLQRLPVMDSAMVRVAGHGPLAGPALTVLTRAGDNLAIYHALEVAQPGDVLVVSGRADISRALMGDLLGELMVAVGVVGAVIDGAVRDVEGLAELGLVVYARAVTPAGPFKFGPGTVDVPIACGGVVVHPGDFVVGDQDGLAVVRPNELEPVLEAAGKKVVDEGQMRDRIAAGARSYHELFNAPTGIELRRPNRPEEGNA